MKVTPRFLLVTSCQTVNCLSFSFFLAECRHQHPLRKFILHLDGSENAPLVTNLVGEAPKPPIKSSVKGQPVLVGVRTVVQSQNGIIMSLFSTICKSRSNCFKNSLCHGPNAGTSVSATSEYVVKPYIIIISIMCPTITRNRNRSIRNLARSLALLVPFHSHNRVDEGFFSSFERSFTFFLHFIVTILS